MSALFSGAVNSEFEQKLLIIVVCSPHNSGSYVYKISCLLGNTLVVRFKPSVAVQEEDERRTEQEYEVSLVSLQEQGFGGATV